MLATPQGAERMRDDVDRVRRFNRFYTRLIGTLDEGHLASPYSLAEARVLYELAHRDKPTAAEIGRDLGLDAGYLSRMLRSFERQRLICRTSSEVDGRQSHLSLTPAGREAFADLDGRARMSIAALLEPLGESARRKIVEAMDLIETSLRSPAQPHAAVLRAHRPGDLGFVVSRQTVLYAQEYGWNQEYEALAARIVADFLENFDDRRERCWIAEQDGLIVGSVFLIRHPQREGVAKLRLLYVEPAARGQGLGRRLVHECNAFARRAGYHTIMLWTNSVLKSARRIYQSEGYRLVGEEPHHSFGCDLVGQTWELSLGAGEAPKRS